MRVRHRAFLWPRLVRMTIVSFVLVAMAGPAGADAEPSRGEGQHTVAASEKSGIEGNVSIGPLRSVEREGIVNQQPYQARITVLDGTGHEVATAESDSQGKFRVFLPPGTYIVRPERRAIYPRAPAQQAEVKPGEMTAVVIVYDTGKR
jgi:hypothetical protein